MLTVHLSGLSLSVSILFEAVNHSNKAVPGLAPQNTRLEIYYTLKPGSRLCVGSGTNEPVIVYLAGRKLTQFIVDTGIQFEL